MIIEHRRHSKRNPPNPHLNSEGVRIARKIGETMGKIDFVLTSVSPRAIETAVAMGFAVDETIDFSTTAKDLPGTPEELPEGTPFAEYGVKYESNEYFKEWGNRVKSLLMSQLSKIDMDKRVLIVSHAGIIEISTIALLSGSDLNSLGKGVDIC
ncbi:MAG: histidine phosphatase family protein, partial [Candidatus Heimdallarchaeota archaeon]